MTIKDCYGCLIVFVLMLSLTFGGWSGRATAQSADDAVKPPGSNLRHSILTPPPPKTPRINGARIYGQRPGRPFLFTVPTTGERPIEYSADGLPDGLSIDRETGRIRGTAPPAGEYLVTLHAGNDLGSDSKPLKIVIGDSIALTPPLGWNSWNCWGPNVDAAKVRHSAQAMVDSGLINHGWTYVNIDDAWQASARGGPFNAIQGNEKFPDMQALCDEVHAMGLKIGIYSTPWKTSYAGYVGGSADNPEGAWKRPENRRIRLHGKYSFATNDANQWAAWGIDYLKYDWNPKSSNPPESVEEFHGHVATMAEALRKSGRDVIYSYSNSMPFEYVRDVSNELNCWRTTGDINDTWWRVVNIGFSQSRWAPMSGPGHWNDPDMLVVGYVDVGRGRNLHLSRLTPDEQYMHISLWSLLASPLLIGCDMTRLDDFTLNLLTNDEVLAINQDPLGKQATRVSQSGPEVTSSQPGRPDRTNKQQQKQIWARKLEDGSMAVGLFNLGMEPTKVAVTWSDVDLEGKQVVRDLWRQKDLGTFASEFSSTVAPHGVVLVKVSPETVAP
jgi:alpha-galactosidase